VLICVLQDEPFDEIFVSWYNIKYYLFSIICFDVVETKFHIICLIYVCNFGYKIRSGGGSRTYYTSSCVATVPYFASSWKAETMLMSPISLWCL
jgi:hypothetical protein